MLQIGTLSRLDLGIKDENNARDLYIDMNTWYTDYPNATFSVWHKRNGDQTKYAASGVSFDRETGILKWTPDAYDTFYVGKGLAEIRCVENDVIKKTKDIITEVARSLVLGSGETLAAGWQNFLNAVSAAANGAETAQGKAEDAKEAAETAQGKAEDAQEAAEEAAEQAVTAATSGPYIDETSKTWMVWDAEDEEYKDTGINAEGEDGRDGRDGTNGKDGKDGQDGYTPQKGVDYWTAEDVAELTEDMADALIDDEAGDGDTDVTWSADKLVEELDKKLNATQKGAAGGLAELDAGGKVPSSQLPGFVDEVQEYADTAHFPLTGESGIIYIALDTNKTYRWGGSGYVEISASLALGETSSTAYRGDRGKTAYDHASAKGSAFSSGLYKVTTNAEGHVTAAVPVTKEDITALGIPGSQPDISGKADKDTDAVQGNFAAFDASGNPVDSGHKHSDYLTEHQDISGKVDKVEGYGLSKNDFSDSEKEKLDNMIDDEAGDGDTDVTWSADKLTGEFADRELSATISTPSSVVSFTDGSPYPMSLQFAIEPVQSGSGDPSPNNVRPITGYSSANINVAGKNLLKLGDSVESNGVTFEPNEDGAYYVHGTAGTGNAYRNIYTNRAISGTEFEKLVGETLILNSSSNKLRLTFNSYDSEGQLLGNRYSEGADVSFAIPDATAKIYVAFRVTAGVQIDEVTHPIIRLSGTDSTWEPYKLTTYPITFPTSAGTVYGGNLTVNPDGTGELVVDTAFFEFDGSDDEKWSVSGITYKYGVITVANYNADERPNSIGNELPYSNIGDRGSEIGFGLHNTNKVRIRYDLLTTLTSSDVKTWLSSHPLQIAYKISDPVSYSLSAPQVIALLNLNHVWADTGDIQSLSYVRNTVPEMIHYDSMGQIGSVRSEVESVESAMVILVDGDTAPKAIASGKYLFVKNNSTLATGIYHATANIANGASVTSSNVAGDPDGAINALLEMILALQ